MKNLIRYLLPSQQWALIVIIVMGIGTGLIAYLLYVSKPVSYLSDDPKTCVNCHVMAPFYDSWQHSSHAHVTTCNDCHVPHTSKLCWDCHREVPHGRVHSLSASPDANVPLPESPVPDWLKSQTEKNTTGK
jgi:nitrate/TMAO reductase-like tetraheme cytochrome c subunit